jgi:hypothetical protein
MSNTKRGVNKKLKRRAIGIKCKRYVPDERDFLTCEEAKKLDDVYWYEEDGKRTLVEDGKELVSGVDDVYWYVKGVYEYKKDGKYTLIENDKVLVSGVDYVYWYAKGVYEYVKDSKYTLIEKGKTLVSVMNGDGYWHKEGVYEYEVLNLY